MNNNYKYQLINTAGQLTPVFSTNVSDNMKVDISKSLLKKYPDAGQVSFLKQRLVHQS